jgi:hypothetical protein
VTTPVLEDPADFRRRLVTGTALLIAGEGIGTWNATGTYTAAQTGIFVMAQPDTPDRQVVLSPFTLTDQPDGSMSLEGLQVKTRGKSGDPFDVTDLDDRIFRLLHARTNYTLSTGIRIVQSLRRSSASLGQDSSRRWSWTSNYYLDAYHPAPNRT